MGRALRDIVIEIWRKYRRDNVSILVSSLAYYTFFSFFPMLLLAASVMGFLFGMGEEYAHVPRDLLGLLPFSSAYLASAIERVMRARRSLGLFGSVLLIWSATAAFDNLQQILNRIHQAPAMRALWRRRLLGVLLGVIVLVFVPLSVGVASVRPTLLRALLHHAPSPATWELVVLTLCTGGLAVLLNFALLLVLYLFGPSVRSGIRQIWVGALVAALLWEFSKWAFGVYIRSLSSYKMLYGSIGSIIAILLWLYVSGTLFALGAEINFVLAARRERGLPRPVSNRRR